MQNTEYQLIRHDGTIHSIPSQGATIGRHRSNDIVVADKQISRQHARILLAAGKCWVRDENSALGVFVNVKRVQGQQELKTGDILQVGNTNFRFVAGQAARHAGPTSPAQKQKLVLIGTAFLILSLGILFMSSGGSGTSSSGGGGERTNVDIASNGGTLPSVDNDYVEPVVQNEGTNDLGQASFRDPGTGEEVLISVVDESGRPLPNLDVIYVHGNEYAYEAYFVQNNKD